MKGKISMIQILIDGINRMMTVFSARLDIANDNAKWYSTFALAECAGIASYLKTEDSLPLQTSLVLLGISLLWFICSVYINFGIRRIMMEQSAQAISQFSDLKGPLEIEISDAAEKDALKKQIHKLLNAGEQEILEIKSGTLSVLIFLVSHFSVLVQRALVSVY
ncbi:MAG: hypothetical protein E2O76_07280 [Caldithrix sp.]|nr:MAG: hypothetical protein E2O76_07280 [Caldithrix sp.]